MPPPTAHMPSGANLGGPVIVPVSLVSDRYPTMVLKRQPNHRGHVRLHYHQCRASPCVGTYIHWVLLFGWLLLFTKWITTGLIGTYIHRVIVIDGYLHSRVYGISAHTP